MSQPKGIPQGQSRQPHPDVFVKKANTAGTGGQGMPATGQMINSQGFN